MGRMMGDHSLLLLTWGVLTLTILSKFTLISISSLMTREVPKVGVVVEALLEVAEEVTTTTRGCGSLIMSTTKTVVRRYLRDTLWLLHVLFDIGVVISIISS